MDMQSTNTQFNCPAREGMPVAYGDLCQQRHLLSAALNALPIPVWLGQVGDDGSYNSAWAHSLFTADSGSWLQVMHPDDYGATNEKWRWAVHTHSPLSFEARLRTVQDDYCWHRLTIKPAYDNGEAPCEWLICAEDIHLYRQAQAELAEREWLRNRMLDASVDCIKILNADGNLEHMNRSGCVALGLGEQCTEFGMAWLNLLPKSVRPSGVRALKRAQQGSNARFNGMSVTADNSVQYWDNILTPILDDAGNTSKILCVSRDITMQRVAEQRLRDASELDELTELCNRRAFRSRLRRLMAHSREQGAMLGLLLVDLDYFKHINDTLGHPAGDHLLKQVAKRLKAQLPEQTLIARLGGDEFAIIVPQLRDEQQLLELAELTGAQLHKPITYNGKAMNSGMSIGAAIYPLHAQDAHSLMKAVDTALNDMKAAGRGGVRLYSERMHQQAQTMAAQLDRARQIVVDGSLRAFYQPKVDLESGQLRGFEALLRWLCPERGPQSPSTVLEAFNDYQLATQIGENMHHLVLTDMTQWRAQGLQLLPVSINAAPVEFLRDDYAERLLLKLAHYNVPPALIEIEVTEHVLNERGSAFVVRALAKLKRAGVRVALDDFGTGHSSLANLRDYPVDCLKIDCDFIWRITTEPSIYAIVQAIAQLGPALAIDVVAEGVETTEQRQFLLRAGCTMGQGQLWGGAMDNHATERLLASVQLSAV